MDFIQFQSHFYIQNTSTKLSNLKFNISQQTHTVNYIQSTPNQLFIFSLIARLAQLSLYSKFQYSNFTHLRLYTSFTQKLFLLINKPHSKGIIIRSFLKSLQQTKKFKNIINPQTGQISFQFCIALDESKIQQQQTLQIFSTIYYNLKQYSLRQFNNIRNFFPQNNLDISNRQYRQYDMTKKMIKTSPYYAWNVLKSTTHSKKQHNKNLYEEMRRNYLEKDNKFLKINEFIEQTKRIYNYDLQKVRVTELFTQKQQQTLKDLYLPKLNTNSRAKLINQITLSEQNFKKLFNDQLCKIQCHQYGKIHLILTKFPSTNIQMLNYQKQIISQLPNQQYMGLPKYYIIKNYKKQTEHCVITNITSGITYWQYLKRNSQSMTIFTKLHLIHQLSLIIKYLTSNKIVYHNLNPKNLFVRKGLCVKATDFTNAYHCEINILNYGKQLNIKKSLLPYVSNYESNLNFSYGDQKSDVFSLGMIIFQTFYGITPIFKKFGKTSNELIHKLLRPLTIGIQKKNQGGDEMIELLTYLSLECIRHEASNSTEQKTRLKKDDCGNKLINVKSRPYLDWMVIIIKFVMENYKKIY